jgi:hypothetical protein
MSQTPENPSDPEETDEELSAQMMRLSEASLREIWDDSAEDVWDKL